MSRIPYSWQIIAVERAAAELAQTGRDPLTQLHLAAVVETLRAIADHQSHDLEYEIKKLEPKSGDVFVIATDQELRDQDAQLISERLTRKFPDMKAMIVDNGLDVSLMTADELRKRLGAQ